MKKKKIIIIIITFSYLFLIKAHVIEQKPDNCKSRANCKSELQKRIAKVNCRSMEHNLCQNSKSSLFNSKSMFQFKFQY